MGYVEERLWWPIDKAPTKELQRASDFPNYKGNINFGLTQSTGHRINKKASIVPMGYSDT